jgi:hypothetical protein
MSAAILALSVRAQTHTTFLAEFINNVIVRFFGMFLPLLCEDTFSIPYIRSPSPAVVGAEATIFPAMIWAGGAVELNAAALAAGFIRETVAFRRLRRWLAY